jgi:hypothetical protein
MCDENPPMADEQLQKLLTRLQEDSGTEGKPEYATEWTQRRHAAELNWKKVRHVVAQTTIAAQATPPTDIRCSKCNIRAPVVRYLTCLDSEGGYSLMCGSVGYAMRNNTRTLISMCGKCGTRATSRQFLHNSVWMVVGNLSVKVSSLAVS